LYLWTGLAGLTEAIEEVFPKTITQRCIVHIVRNIYSILPKKGVKEIIGDFKKIYTAANLTAAKLEYKNFIEKYKENEKLIKKVEENINHIFQLFEYPAAIRKVIYTTNTVESLNSALRKVTRGKGSFISIQALLKVLYLRVQNLQKKWAKGIQNWGDVRFELMEIFRRQIYKIHKILKNTLIIKEIIV